MFLRRAATVSAIFGVSLALCYLAWLPAELLVWRSPSAWLALLGAANFYGFQPHWAFPALITRFSSGGRVLFALNQSGFILSAAVIIASGSFAAARASNWLRWFGAYLVASAGSMIVLFAGLYSGWHQGPFRAAMFSLGVPAGWWRGIAVPACALPAFLAVCSAVGRALDSVASGSRVRLAAWAGLLLAPAVFLFCLLFSQTVPYRGLQRQGLAWIPAATTAIAGVVAVFLRRRPAKPFHPTFAGSAGIWSLSALALAALLGYHGAVRQLNRLAFSQQRRGNWVFYFDPATGPATTQARLAADAGGRIDSARVRLGLPATPRQVDAYFYATPEAKEKASGDTAPFTLLPARLEIHDLLAPGGSVNDPRGEVLLLLHAAWGEPGNEAVARSLARFAVGSFHGFSLSSYAARITREEGAYTLRDILHLCSDSLSPLAADALGGAWVEKLVEEGGRGILPSLYRARLAAGGEGRFAQAVGSTWDKLEENWQAALRRNAGGVELPGYRDNRTQGKATGRLQEGAGQSPTPAAMPTTALGDESPAVISRLGTEGFQRGITLSHEVGGAWGYGSEQARRQLQELRAIRANSVAIIPYAFTRAPKEIHLSANTDERDDRVIRTILQARELGLATMLKPQLWARGFTGDIAFQDSIEFDRWFVLYRRWMLHYARMAELYGVDLLVIGNELGGITTQEAAWRGLIHDVRQVYSGPVTYAAGWGGDAEKLRFWDALDYIGINMYYPLAGTGERPEAGSPRLLELEEKFASLSRKNGKPVLFTEVGYPSRLSAAARPWDIGESPVDPALQQFCYQVVFEQFYGRPWLAGMYWWNWPSHGGGSAYDGSYSPIGKPARDVLASWYGRLLRPERAQLRRPPK